MKSKYNFVMSILGGVSAFVLLILSIIFHSISKDTLGVVFSSLFYSFIIIYFIFNSIHYSSGSTPLYRLGNITSSIFTTLILIYFILNYNSIGRWILLGLVLFLLIIEILLDSFDKLIEFKYLYSSIKLMIILFLFVSFYKDIILLLGTMSVVIYYFSRLLGRVLKNKYVLSFDVISLLIFGIFYLFI